MIRRLIKFSAENRFIVLLFAAFLTIGAWWCYSNMALDAIPDLSDTQVIVYSKWDRSPDIVEDQLTYPIVTALLGLPKVKTVRGISDFGFSYVYVIFEDGTDIYWARSRVTEFLGKITSQLPSGSKTELGPDATSIGWVYQYALVDESKKLNLADLRSIQDWQLRFHLQSVPGVAEVASIGGFTKQYQVNVDPNRLAHFSIPLSKLVEAVRSGNNETGGRLVEFSGREFMVRGRGYAKSIEDIERIVVSVDDKTGTPILVKNVATVEIGPDIRRGVTDLDGLGDTAGGIILMRQGENVNNVISRVKDKLEQIIPTLPPGVKIVTTYDRSRLVDRALATLRHELVLEMIIVSAVILIFLWHIPSAIVPILTIPISVILAFIPLWAAGVTSNIMSLAGIAISIGVLVDGAIVEVENAYKRLEEWNSNGRQGDFHQIRLNALLQVAPSVFFSLLVISVSFLPIFMLLDQEGRLFRPLAFSKTMTMTMAAILALTLDPAMRMLFTRMDPFQFKPLFAARWLSRICVGTYRPEESHPITRVLHRIYGPVVDLVLKYPWPTIAVALGLVATTVPIYERLGSEFMPPLQEESFLYMPTSFPGMAISEAKRLLQIQDAIIKEFPEVETVYGKAGRADTATDPAPLSMFETTVTLRPQEQWPKIKRWYSDWPESLQSMFRSIWPDHESYDSLQTRLNERLSFPGIPNIWTMPIKNRVDMLSTGIRTSIGIKVTGPDLNQIQSISEQIERTLKSLPDTKTAYGERAADGYYIDFQLNRDALARHGISIDQANMIISSAVGGENVSTTIEGRERYPINIRYHRAFREDINALKRVLVSAPTGMQIPLSQLAEIKMVQGPAMIRNENGMLAGYVYIDTTDKDIGGYIARARAAVSKSVSVPPGYSLIWSGQFENMERVKARLALVIPVTILIIFLLLYLNTGSLIETAIVLLAVPFSLVGSIWLLYLLGYNLSVAVGVGLIALLGLDAETGVFMLLYLDMAYKDAEREGRLKCDLELKNAVHHGAVKRIRPKAMTVIALFAGLIPIMLTTATGSDVMKRIAAPMIGGLATSFILELLIYPAIFYLWKRRSLKLAHVH